MQQLSAFLDTNTFLHFPRLDQLDWPELLQATDVLLIISPVVIRELNRHKDFPTSTKTRERAATALRILDKWSDESSPVLIRKFVELQFRVQDPLIEFAAFNLSREISDDHLIATILEHRSGADQGPILLVTADLGLKLKAKTHQIPVFQLPANLRLPDEVLPEEKKLRELEIELKRLRNRVPRVQLAFANHEQRLRVQLPSSDQPTIETLGAVELRTQHPKMQIPTPACSHQSGQSLAGLDDIPLQGIQKYLNEIPPEDIEKYNEQLDRFYVECEKYTSCLKLSYALRDRTVCANISAINDGSCPAQDVHLFVHFPDGFDLLTEDTLPKEPPRPKPPRKPETRAENMARGFQLPNSFFLHAPHVDLPPTTGPANVSSPSIRRTNSYDVEVKIKVLRHGFAEALAPLYLIFESRESIRSFTIEYRIYAANLPDPSVGQLHFIVDASTK
jgi:rRNA-processing protein FCF1